MRRVNVWTASDELRKKLLDALKECIITENEDLNSSLWSPIKGSPPYGGNTWNIGVATANSNKSINQWRSYNEMMGNRTTSVNRDQKVHMDGVYWKNYSDDQDYKNWKESKCFNRGGNHQMRQRCRRSSELPGGNALSSCVDQCLFVKLQVVDKNGLPVEALFMELLETSIPEQQMRRKARSELHYCFQKMASVAEEDTCIFGKQFASCLDLNVQDIKKHQSNSSNINKLH
ncbi:uncharacterized protein LOC126419492 [Schistocerca serialis cubense]|uniref:uncharacterized protein LOC126419492 n=1 Tax=Schistocerca serialis cubense TaxID=2023355 RepID=UPI00214ED38B|nr:uncharacterized protein LOC126419492 [Schistocerca serialis cubense]